MDKKGSNIKNNCFTLRGKRFSRTETRVRFVLYLLHNKILKLDIKKSACPESKLAQTNI